MGNAIQPIYCQRTPHNQSHGTRHPTQLYNGYKFGAEHWCEIRLVESAENLPKFHKFKELPFELREKIWKYAFPEARVLYHDVTSTYSGGYWGGDNTNTEIELYHDVFPTNDDKGHILAESQNLRLSCREARQVFHDAYKPMPLLDDYDSAVETTNPPPDHWGHRGPNHDQSDSPIRQRARYRDIQAVGS